MTLDIYHRPVIHPGNEAGVSSSPICFLGAWLSAVQPAQRQLLATFNSDGEAGVYFCKLPSSYVPGRRSLCWRRDSKIR